MKRIVYILMVFGLTIALGSCNGRHKKTKHVVKEYVQHTKVNDIDADVYWYLMMSDNGNNYYYYSSSTPVTNFSTVNWTESTTNPITAIDQTTITAEPDVSVSNTEMSESMQSEFTESNGFEATEADATSSESGGFESSTDNSSDGGNDGGSSDGGSSDGGGGGDGGGD